VPLSKFQFRPGINREITSYSNEGGWFDGDKIRFRASFPEKINGWQRLGNSTFLGTCRALHLWRTLGLDTFLGVGTHLKYYIEYGQAYFDVTPLRRTTSAGAVTFAAVNGSATLTVTDAGHGAVPGDFVTYTDAVTLGGDITAAVLNQEYQIASVTDSSTYTIIARAVASLSAITIDGEYTPTPVVANASDTGDGGAGVIGEYQINIGLDTSVFGTGWGAVSWSRGSWGSAATIDLIQDTLRLWTHDHGVFGEDLLFNVQNGGIYYWDSSGGLSTRGVAISDLAGSDLAPTIAAQVLVSDIDRHVIAFGCDPLENIGVQDPLLIRFSSQESATDWRPTATNTAGDLRIGSGSKIVRALETRQQTIIFTDMSLHAMQYLGPPFIFGVQKISENVTIQSPNAAVAVDDRVFWMGRKEFYVYEGTVNRLPCTVRDYVFDDFNFDQSEKTFAAANTANSEIWWFYPSLNSAENDRYVVYNYLEQVWYYGNLARTAWFDRGVEELPTAAGTDNRLYEHEIGFDDGSTVPPSPIEAFVQSSPIDLGDGEQFVFMRRLIPDVDFRNSAANDPSIDVTTRVRNFNSGNYLRTTTSTIDESTEQVHLRLRGRQFSVRVASDGLEVGWRLGSLRYDLRPDGRR
jgi:hypothetical protein